MTTLLEIKNLTGGYLPHTPILQDIHLDIRPGEAVGLIGLNGSGKSTLGKAVMNMLPYRQGEIRYEGKSVSHLSTDELARSGIAIMLQGGQIFSTLTIWENLQIASGNLRDAFSVAELSSFVPLLRQPEKRLRTRMADKLSGGERHQLALAMALVRSPHLLVLDEPSAGLSPKNTDELYRILETIRIQKKLAFLLIEQNIHKAIFFCHHCLLLEQGRLVQKFLHKDLREVEKTMFKNKSI